VARYAIELILALVAIVVITILYAFLTWDAIPAPGTLAGHGLGIVGFLLMLATETLYTFRKRLRGFQYGPTGVWLRVHIFTGIVGPYLALLHTAGKLNGLAGVLTFVTVVVVMSGFVGRYIYTATPRTIDGVEVGVEELQR
jgi:xanthosine utilization system XapX-like protein